MDSYVYLAEDRINYLYQTICPVSREKHVLKVDASMGILKVGYNNEVQVVESIISKLNAVLRQLEASDSNAVDNHQYIKASIPMSWNSIYPIQSDIESTYWCGVLDASKGDFYSSTIIFLIGSGHNIVGNSKEVGRYRSTSYIAAFFKAYEDSINSDSGTASFLNKNADHELSVLKAIDNSRSLLSEEEKLLAKKEYLSHDPVPEYLHALHSNYCGNFCEYAFVAEELDSGLFFDKNNTLAKYIIAAPLYVTRRKVFDSRIVTITGRRMYVLSAAEFEEHKRTAFQSLSALLLSEHLDSEEKSFSAEMRKVYRIMGGKTIFDSTVQISEFVKRTQPIVLDYFYIYDETKDEDY